MKRGVKPTSLLIVNKMIHYYIDKGCTVKEAAAQFGRSREFLQIKIKKYRPLVDSLIEKRRTEVRQVNADQQQRIKQFLGIEIEKK